VCTKETAVSVIAICYFESEVYRIGKRNRGLRLQQEIPVGSINFSVLHNAHTGSYSDYRSTNATKRLIEEPINHAKAKNKIKKIRNKCKRFYFILFLKKKHRWSNFQKTWLL
jgi:hypothetical protein